MELRALQSSIKGKATLIVGIPKEIAPNEKRVAATPSLVKKLLKLGVSVSVESGAGEGAGFLDGAFAEIGATIAPDAISLWKESDVVFKVRPPMVRADGLHEADLLKEGGALLGFLWPAQSKDLIEQLAARHATVLAMDAMPRITRAQKMDALSAMANIVGYRSVVEAASQFGRFFSGQMTAAGRVAPAQVMIIGAGVAGLAAIATARSLGAVVRAFDTRPAVREQVQSLGARFIDFKFDESGEGVGGYAKQVSEAFLSAEQTLIAENAKECDVIITTAVIPGAAAPQLITSGAVVSMKPGSVIIDLAAEQGGNCALTERDQVVERFGVKIVGYTDLASRMANQSSELYATTVYHLFESVFDAKNGAIALNLKDEIHRGVVVLEGGELRWPPPRPEPPSHAPLAENKPSLIPIPPPAPAGGKMSAVVSLVLACLLGAAGLFAQGDFLEHLTVFLLACVVGWHVVWNVTPALHTPLMSVTNAISGIILIGGVLLLRVGGLHPATMLAGVAILLAMINVAGGFLVTARMLRMFRRGPKSATSSTSGGHT